LQIRPLLLLAPVVLGGTMVLAAPQAVRAGSGMTETGTTTYEVIPGRNLIGVTIQISIHNDSPNETNGGSVTIYYWNSTSIMVEQAAGTVSATSDGGRVTQNTGSSDQYYKVIKLNYPNVYYGQTRLVTATYTIPGTLNARDNFRAGQAYASLCAVGNGQDKGTVSVVIPDGYQVHDIAGGQLTKTDNLGAKQVYTSGPLTNPYKFATCLQATNPANMTHAALTSGSQTFDLQGWPEDSTWSTAVRGDVSGDFQRLEDLTGLKGPGGTVVVAETGGGINDDGVTYDPKTATVGIPEGANPNVVAHALAHIWFNPTMFGDTWLSEGLAGYGQKAAGEGSYTPCTEPGVYPASGPPDLMTWRTLNFNSTTQDQNISDWQYSASCYFFTALANAMGPDGFRSFMKAAAAGEMAYLGATPGEKLTGAKLPLTSRQVLDLLDERGMVGGGVTDLDQAQKLLADWGVFDPASLAARSKSRATYHALASSAGAWKLPLAVRGPMSTWDFAAADAAMAKVRQILDVRDSIAKGLSGFSLDGTAIQKQFESAATGADLDSLLALIKKESDAAGTLDHATKLNDAGRSILQSIGLIANDNDATLAQARADLVSVKPDLAGAEAQSVIDRINGSNDLGLVRSGVVAGVLGILLLAIALTVTLRRRRRAGAAIDNDDGDSSVPFEPGDIGEAVGAGSSQTLDDPSVELAPVPGGEPAVEAAEEPAVEPSPEPAPSEAAPDQGPGRDPTPPTS
jgi:hypothetical protein